MAIINQIDCGSYSPWNAPAQTWAGPAWGQATHTVNIEGEREIAYVKGGTLRTRTETIWLIPPSAIGGQQPGSQDAVLYLLRQLLELVDNSALQPCFIQWRSGGGTLVDDTEDGWHIITDIKPDVEFIWTGIIPVTITVIYLGPASPPSRISMAYSGGVPTSNFSATAANLVAFPFGATTYEASFATFTRTGAEGAIPCLLSPVSKPVTFLPSATIANLFKGSVRVYDTINTGTNPIPTTSFVAAGWLEVFAPDHNFYGDCIVTNGLAMMHFVAGGALSVYLWNTALSPASWQKWTEIAYVDSVGGTGNNIITHTLTRVGPDATSITCFISTTASAALFKFKMKRGRYDIELKYRSLTDSGSSTGGPLLRNFPANGPKIAYNSISISDNVNPPNEPGPAPATDYGYGAGFINSTSQPYIFGILYRNQPTSKQPQTFGATNKDIAPGDAGVGVDEIRTYGIFAIPYGVSGTYSTANLQGEAESGILGTGWTSQANAAASGGNEAKCTSGTLTGNADTWGTAFVPLVGQYDTWVRMKVTSAAGAVSEMQIGWWDNDTGAFVASTTYRANQVTTGYLWYKVTSLTTPTATKNMRFRAVTTATIGTDWFMDEACAVLRTRGSNIPDGPDQIYQQFAYDSGQKLNRAA